MGKAYKCDNCGTYFDEIAQNDFKDAGKRTLRKKCEFKGLNVAVIIDIVPLDRNYTSDLFNKYRHSDICLECFNKATTKIKELLIQTLSLEIEYKT